MSHSFFLIKTSFANYYVDIFHQYPNIDKVLGGLETWFANIFDDNINIPFSARWIIDSTRQQHINMHVTSISETEKPKNMFGGAADLHMQALIFRQSDLD
jgi:hypothetical protein